jgi:DNA-directed RNA polymerase subunit RPC12/RpoP
MEYKCPECGETADYLDVEVVNIFQYTIANLPDNDNEDILFGDYETNYDECQDSYYCPNCGFKLPIHDEEALLKYVKENQA